MESAVEFAKTMRIDMGIDLRSADVGVSEQLLYRPNVGPVLEHVRREAVPQDVRGYPLRRYARRDGALPQHLEHSLPRERRLGGRGARRGAET